ncbi:MAG: hypothetical protein AAF670_02250 [Planctomycetota bacterium]
MIESNELIHRYVLGIATGEQTDELERRLQNDSLLQDEFLLQAEMDMHLRQEALGVAEAADDILSDTAPSAKTASRAANATRRFVEWGTIGVAATVLLAFGILQFVEGPTALASVQRSLKAAAEMTTRKYLLQVEIQPPFGPAFTREHELYVQGKDRFALRLTGLFQRRKTWLGQDGQDYWVVPPSGSVLTGTDPSLHSRWVRSTGKELDREGEVNEIPLTHVTTMLQRMSEGYDLAVLDDKRTEIANGDVIQCQRILATRAAGGTASDRPDTIELWASRETGIPIRIQARWNLAVGAVGKKSAVLSFQREESSIADEWFSADGH